MSWSTHPEDVILSGGEAGAKDLTTTRSHDAVSQLLIDDLH